MNNMMDNYLQHYGVKGMKWGVRKRPISPSSGGRSSSVAKKKRTSFLAIPRRKKTRKVAEKKQVSLKKKSVKQMTNEELNEHIKRLEMEKKYKDLKRSEISMGKKLMGNIAQKSIENIGTQLVTYGLGTAVNKAFKSDIVNPKKGQRDKK